MHMNAKDLLNKLRQLSRSDRLTLVKMLLAIEPPREESRIDLSYAMSFVSKAPPQYRQPLISLLSESDKMSNGNSLCIEDIINMTLTLLMLTQDHEAHDVGGSFPATIAHDFILEANLDKMLNS